MDRKEKKQAKLEKKLEAERLKKEAQEAKVAAKAEKKAAKIAKKQEAENAKIQAKLSNKELAKTEDVVEVGKDDVKASEIAQTPTATAVEDEVFDNENEEFEQEEKKSYSDAELAKYACAMLGIEYPGDEYFTEKSEPEKVEPAVAPVVETKPVEKVEPVACETVEKVEPVVAPVVETKPVENVEPVVAPVVETKSAPAKVEEKVEVQPVQEKVEETAPTLTPEEIAQKLYDERNGSLSREQFAAHVGTYLGITENYNGLAETLYLKYGAKSVATIQDQGNTYKATMRIEPELGRALVKVFDCVEHAKFPKSPYWYDVEGNAPANLLVFMAETSYSEAVKDAQAVVEQKQIQYKENLENDESHISVKKLLAHAATRQFVTVEVTVDTGSANVKFKDKTFAIVSGNNLNFKLNMRCDPEIAKTYEEKEKVSCVRAKFPHGSDWHTFALTGDVLRKTVENVFNDSYTYVRKESMSK